MTAPLKAQSFADLKPLRRTLQERAAQQGSRFSMLWALKPLLNLRWQLCLL